MQCETKRVAIGENKNNASLINTLLDLSLFTKIYEIHLNNNKTVKMLDGALFVVKCASTKIGEKTFSPILFL